MVIVALPPLGSRLDAEVERAVSAAHSVRVAGAEGPAGPGCVGLVLGDGPAAGEEAVTAVVRLFDCLRRPLVGSPLLTSVGEEGDTLEVLTQVSRDGHLGWSSGRVANRGNPTGTLIGVLNVLPTLVRRALADPVSASTAPHPPDQNGAERRGTLPSRALSSRIAARVRRELDRASLVRDWHVAVVSDRTLDALLSDPDQPTDIRRLCASRWPHFWADPCPVTDENGRTWLFVEELPRFRGRGRIVALRVEGGVVRERRVVLDDEHHRAFPRVYRVQGRWFATVDTCESPSPLFEFASLGTRWRRMEGAFLPPALADPALHLEGRDWYVMGTAWLEDGNAACETWHSRGGPPFSWHRMDARGYVDVRAARGAGPWDVARGVRATQDCAPVYGSAVHLSPVGPHVATELGPRFDGSTFRTVGDRGRHGIEGIHTLAWNEAGDVIAVDTWVLRRHAFAWLWNAREGWHVARCQAATRARSLHTR